MIKNQDNQIWSVYAYYAATGLEATGVAATITATIKKDTGAYTPTDNTNPTEDSGGDYHFNLLQAETNANEAWLRPVSSTAGIVVIPNPGGYVTVPLNYADLGIEADGDITKVNTVESLTTNNDKSGYSISGTKQTLDVLQDLSSAEANAACDQSLIDYDGPTNAQLNARTIVSGDYFDPSADTVSNVNTVATLSGHTAQTGDSYTRLGAPVSTDISTDIANVQTSVNNIGSASSGAINFEITGDNTGGPIKGATFIGVQTGTYENISADDGNYHEIGHVANVIDIAYVANVGGFRNVVEVTFAGYLNSGNDIINIQAYDYSTSQWDTRKTITGQNIVTDLHQTIKLLEKHTGIGADLGEVLIRFVTPGGQSSPTLYINEMLVSAVSTLQTVGYQNGAVWYDSVLGTPGSTPYLNGTADKPVDNYGDLKTLLTELNLRSVQVAQGSSIDFDGDVTNRKFDGVDYIINFNGYKVDSTVIKGGVLSGEATGNGGSLLLIDCQLINVTLPEVACIHCAYAGTITLGEIGTYVFEDGFSAIAGQLSPIWDFGSSIGDTNVNFRHNSSGIDIRNLGQNGNDTVTMEGFGQYILNSNCVGGNISVRGLFHKTDNSNGLVTIVDDANYTNSIIQSGFSQGPGTGNNQIILSAAASSIDGSYDPSMVIIIAGNGAGQTRLIYQYNGTSKTATIDRDWKVNPDITSEYRIIAHPGREGVNEGLAQAGTIDTITLNALASTGDSYRNQLVYLRSGLGQDQVRRIKSYDGGSKIATLSEPWDVIPNSTSAYTIIPFACVEVQAIGGQELSVKTGRNFDIFFNASGADTSTEVNIIDAIFANTGTDLPAQITSVHNDTDTLIGNLENISTSDVKAQADLALSDIRLNEILKDALTAAPISESLYGDLTEDNAGTQRFTVAALVNAPSGGGGGDATEAKQDEIISVLGTPADIDSGGATVSDNLKKLADDNGGLSFDAANDSLKSIRDRGDAAWLTGGGGAISQIINAEALIPQSIDLANTATVRLGYRIVNSVDDLPTGGEIVPGTISIDRKAIGGTAWIPVVVDGVCSESAGLIYYDEVFDSGSNYAEGDSIKVTFKSQSVIADGNTFEITGSTGVVYYTELRQTMVGTNGANTVTPDIAGTAATLHATTDSKIDDLDAKVALDATVAKEATLNIVDGKIDTLITNSNNIYIDTQAILSTMALDSTVAKEATLNTLDAKVALDATVAKEATLNAIGILLASVDGKVDTLISSVNDVYTDTQAILGTMALDATVSKEATLAATPEAIMTSIVYQHPTNPAHIYDLRRVMHRSLLYVSGHIVRDTNVGGESQWNYIEMGYNTIANTIFKFIRTGAAPTDRTLENV